MTEEREFVEAVAAMVRDGEPAPEWAVQDGHLNEDGTFSDSDLAHVVLDEVIVRAREILADKTTEGEGT